MSNRSVSKATIIVAALNISDARYPSPYNTYSFLDVFKRENVDISSSLPGWKTLIAKGKDATTNRQKSTWSFSVTADNVTCIYKYPWFGEMYDGYFIYTGHLGWTTYSPLKSGVFPVPRDSTLTEAANRAFVKKLVNIDHSFQGGVFVAELHKTVRAIRHPFVALRKAYNGYLDTSLGYANYITRRYGTRQKKLQHILEAVSGTWLETQLSIAPTIRDLEEGYSALQRISSDESVDTVNIFVKKTSVTNSTGNASFVQTMYGAPSIPQWDIIESERSEEMVTISGAIRVRPPLGVTLDPKSLLGIRNRDFIPSLYELLPWSFLTDYFLNIQGAIDAWSLPQQDFVYASKSVKIKRDTLRRFFLRPIVPDGDYGDLRIIGSISPVKFSVSSIQRDRWEYNWLDYAPQLRIPGLDTRWANIFSLFSQQAILNGILKSL